MPDGPVRAAAIESEDGRAPKGEPPGGAGGGGPPAHQARAPCTTEVAIRSRVRAALEELNAARCQVVADNVALRRAGAGGVVVQYLDYHSFERAHTGIHHRGPPPQLWSTVLEG